MKFTCTQENLSKGLEVVSHVASKNTNLPILSNILLEAKEGTLRLAATDLEIGIDCLVRGKIEKEGSFTVDGRLITDYVNLLEGERVNLEVEGQTLKIEGRGSNTSIKGVEATEFPVIPGVEKGKNYQCKASEFKSAISQTIFAVAHDDSRPEISGVFMDFSKKDPKELVIAATDTYRLAEKIVKLEKSAGGNVKVIVPTKTLQELSRILDPDQNFEITVTENQILFQQGDIKIISRVIEGQYPNYQQVIPEEYKTKVLLPREDFMRTVKKASLFSKTGINDVNLKIDPTKGEIKVLAANSQLGENISVVAGKIEGDENEIVFNYRYLLEGLGCLNVEEVDLEIISKDVAGVLRPVGKKGYSYVIMPIKQ